MSCKILKRRGVKPAPCVVRCDVFNGGSLAIMGEGDVDLMHVVPVADSDIPPDFHSTDQTDIIDAIAEALCPREWRQIGVMDGHGPLAMERAINRFMNYETGFPWTVPTGPHVLHHQAP